MSPFSVKRKQSPGAAKVAPGDVRLAACAAGIAGLVVMFLGAVSLWVTRHSHSIEELQTSFPVWIGALLVMSGSVAVAATFTWLVWRARSVSLVE